jgi:hypothetical protein
MIGRRPMFASSYLDDPAEKVDPDRSTGERNLAFALASSGLTCVGEWITRGRGGARQRALRSDIVLLCICPHFLPCKHPSASWVGREHGVSRQRANNLRKEFACFLAPYVQFRGQRSLCLTEHVHCSPSE